MSKFGTKFSVLVLVVGLTFILSFSITSVAEQDAEYICRYGDSWPASSDRGKAAQVFKEVLELTTDGKIKVELGLSNQYGSEAECMDLVKMNQIQATRGALFEEANKKFLMWNMPFLFDSYKEAVKTRDAPMLDEIEENAKENGFYIPTTEIQPPRQLFTIPRPIEELSDVKGLKIRVPPIDVNRRTMNAIGANTQEIPFADTYMALQNKTIDGIEPYAAATVAKKFYEQLEYFSIIDWCLDVGPLFISLEWYNSLPSELQEEVTLAAEVSVDYYQELCVKGYEESIEFLRSKLETNTVSDEAKKAFREATKSIWDHYIDKGFFAEEEIEELREYSKR